MEINETNFKMYQDFLDVSNWKALGNHMILWPVGMTIIAFGILGGVTIGMVPIVKLIHMLIGGLVNSLFVLCVEVFVDVVIYLGTLVATFFKGFPKIVEGILIRNFKKKYPNFVLI